MIQPLGSKVLALRLDLEKTTSGILIPERAAKRNAIVRARVIAVGPGRWLTDPDTGELRRRPMGIEPGEVIWFPLAALFDSENPSVLDLDEKQYGILEEDSILLAGDESAEVI